MSSYDDILSNLSQTERDMTLKILTDMSAGDIESYNKLIYSDYKEIPVDINTFLHDKQYLGKGVIDAEDRFTVFPFWMDTLNKVFPNNVDTAYNTLILSGAIGIGKSFIAVICMLYLLHRMLCLKDPYQHYGLQPIDQITFSMLNLTMDAAKGVGWSKLQELLKCSPWFKQHGWIDRKQEEEWHPFGNIELLYGSQTKHIIGRAVFCLSGDTPIVTSEGVKTIESCVGQPIQVVSYDTSVCRAYSDTCTVLPTDVSNIAYDIQLVDGTVIRCTPSHLFMMFDKSFRQAKDLKSGDVLVDADNSSIIVKSAILTKLDKPIQFYDVIQAAPFHNFLVKTTTGSIVSHNCNFLDEASFRQNQDIEKQKQYALELVSTADARMQSRFMKGNRLPTLGIIASSKRTDQSFLESYIDMKEKNESKTTLVIDEPQWVIRTDKAASETFAVAVGNKFLESQVLPLNVSDSELSAYRDKGYTILDVPIGYRENFVDNLDIALTDIAGMSVSNSMRYISGERWAKCRHDNLSNPFTKEVIEVGNSATDTAQYCDFFDIARVPTEMKSRPLYIHMDMSVSGDKTGIAGTWIKGKKPAVEGQPASKELYFQLAFSVAVKAPRGYQVSFEKNRQFIYWLHDQGFNIKGVSSDTYQSYDTGQALKAKGYAYDVLSVDRVNTSHICEPYQYFKSTIYEERLITYDTKLLTDEVIGVVRYNSGRIDHTPSGINSKDISDAVCGSIFNASQNAEQFAYDFGEDLSLIVEQNRAGNDTAQKEQITVDFEEMIKTLVNPQTDQPDDVFMDFGLGKARPLSSNDAYYISQGIII